MQRLLARTLTPHCRLGGPQRRPLNRRLGGQQKPPEPPRSADPFAMLFGQDMWLGGGVSALGAIIIYNGYDDLSRGAAAEEAARERTQCEQIRAQREARRRELDRPARLALKKRQLAHFRKEGDAGRVAELERDLAALGKS